ncbi:D-alanyl-D-alanine carboxypeptidase [Rhizobiaceae bacterium BDR2-2]|uniref:D-alanyl-D-alanine carboxypeptidase n=1 Tax=Ectorhizobium quercum TaxID=2965071 RepID=A0AAE3N0K3_9HYPH|nr:D-alanyl-D-alanine carboxypeptidase family protein [Ectorhizobium quercum]MCX8997911.1 D-alanyl-D-alanine carboxypeptidase [Ectorhizobium quercum]
MVQTTSFTRVCARRIALALLPLLLTGAPARATPALVVDADTLQVLHSEDAGHLWYPASTTKLMTAFVVFESLRAGRVTLDSTVVLSRNAMNQRFLNAGLRVGSAMTLEDALFAVIVGSTNDVAVAVAETVAGSEAAFVGMMNDAAARLGMTASHFANPNGLFDREHRSSARDLAILGIAVARRFPDYQRFFRTTRVVIDGKEVESHNELLTRFPGAIGMKTGFLCASGQNIVALAERQGRQVMVVMLGATTERERNERAAQFLTQAFAGELQPVGAVLSDLPNDAGTQPEDMRMKLCSDRTAAYESTREAMYPMGLPGQTSYLGPAGQGETRAIRTWSVSVTETVPVPIPVPRPSHM